MVGTPGASTPGGPVAEHRDQQIGVPGWGGPVAGVQERGGAGGGPHVDGGQHADADRGEQQQRRERVVDDAERLRRAPRLTGAVTPAPDRDGAAAAVGRAGGSGVFGFVGAVRGVGACGVGARVGGVEVEGLVGVVEVGFGGGEGERDRQPEPFPGFDQVFAAAGVGLPVCQVGGAAQEVISAASPW